jgi:hypothetical protein
VLFVSLEMSAIELADRLLCSVARVNGHRLRNGTISNDDRKRLVKSAAELSQAPLFVDDSPSRTVTEIAAAARRIRRRCDNQLGLIVIDYLQLIEPDNPRDPRQEQVSRMTRRLKGLAREMKVPILCLSQLNRQAEDSKDHRPRLSHLRESGAIEQDADVVMFVHREEYYHRGDEQEQYAGQAEIIIAKQRNGPVGDVELVWLKDFTRFEDKAPERFEQFDDSPRLCSAGVTWPISRLRYDACTGTPADRPRLLVDEPFFPTVGLYSDLPVRRLAWTGDHEVARFLVCSIVAYLSASPHPLSADGRPYRLLLKNDRFNGHGDCNRGALERCPAASMVTEVRLVLELPDLGSFGHGLLLRLFSRDRPVPRALIAPRDGLAAGLLTPLVSHPDDPVHGICRRCSLRVLARACRP